MHPRITMTSWHGNTVYITVPYVSLDVVLTLSISNGSFLRDIHRLSMDSCAEGTVMRSFGVFFVVNLNKLLKNDVAGDMRRLVLMWRCSNAITITSQWARWRLKSPASPLFIQLFIQAQIKENIKAQRHWPLCAVNSPVTGEFPAQRASNAENISIWWRHHGVRGTPRFSG